MLILKLVVFIYCFQRSNRFKKKNQNQTMPGAEKDFHYFISETQVYDPRKMAADVSSNIATPSHWSAAVSIF